MVDRVYPVAAVTGAPSYDGRALRQTAVAPFIAGATATRPLGARSGVRPGTPATTVSATSTTWTVQPHAGVIDAESANEAGPYAYAFDAVKTGAMTAANASYARIDLISVQISDPAESDGSSTPGAAIVYTPGTAAAPALPTQPARSMVIAQINVPISGGGSPAATWVAPTLAAAGGITPATSAAFGSGTYVGQYIDDPTSGLMRWSGTAWVPGGSIDTGWITTGWALASGWTPTSAGGWRSLAYRRIGKQFYLNGTVQKSSTYAANELILTMPSGTWPSGRANMTGANSNLYISSDGTVKTTNAGSASVPFGVDLMWWID